VPYQLKRLEYDRAPSQSRVGNAAMPWKSHAVRRQSSPNWWSESLLISPGSRVKVEGERVWGRGFKCGFTSWEGGEDLVYV
jgi:hypothetical protein